MAGVNFCLFLVHYLAWRLACFMKGRGRHMFGNGYIRGLHLTEFLRNGGIIIYMDGMENACYLNK